MEELWAVTNAHSRVSLTYDGKNEWFYVKWSGHIASEDVVAAAQAYLEFQKVQQCAKLISDKSEVSGNWEESNDWLEYEWLPQVKDSGLQHFALVLSRNLHELATAQDLHQRLSQHCNVALFRELSSAMEWLKEQPV